jgi:hypothetical protein
MKIFDAIRLANRNKIPARVGRVQSVATSEPLGSMVLDCHWRVRHEVSVAFESTGPEAAIPDMRKQAVQAIAREIFGELQSDLQELRVSLWEEDFYRASDDPVFLKIEDMLSKMGGTLKESSDGS